MITRRKFAFSTIALLAAPSCSLGGFKTLDGDEEDAWKDGAYNLMVAEVKDISAVTDVQKREKGTHRATLTPIATLAGTLDPSAAISLDVRMYIGIVTTSILTVPRKGDVVLAVLKRRDYVATDDCPFMPDRAALVTVDGLGDKRVMETIGKLRLKRHPAG